MSRFASRKAGKGCQVHRLHRNGRKLAAAVAVLGLTTPVRAFFSFFPRQDSNGNFIEPFTLNFNLDRTGNVSQVGVGFQGSDGLMPDSPYFPNTAPHPTTLTVADNGIIPATA